MKAIRIPTANGLHDIKLIGEDEFERAFIKQLAEAGTLSCISRNIADSALFRPISVTDAFGSSNYSSVNKSIGKYDFTILQNANEIFDLKFNDGDVPLNLTQYSGIKLQVKSRKSAPAIVTLSIGSGLTITGPSQNILGVSFSAANTLLLSCGDYYYDVLMIKPTSNVYYLEGKITVKNTGTR